MMLKRIFLIVLLILAYVSCDYEVTQLFDGQEMPGTENAVFMKNGRFFLIGFNGHLYEVIQSGDHYDYNIITTAELDGEPCSFSGLATKNNILFAACVLSGNRDSAILRIDPFESNHDRRVITSPYRFGNNILLNGMVFDRHGVLYVSNSMDSIHDAPGVYRIEILNENIMELDVSPFLNTDQFDIFEEGLFGPNGAQIAPSPDNLNVDRLYLVEGRSLYSMDIIGEGHGAISKIYTTSCGLKYIDDFAIHGEYLALTVYNLASIISPEIIQSEVVLIHLSDTGSADVLGSTFLDLMPSSIAYREYSLFGEHSLMVTSFVHGGLYKIAAQ